MLLFVGLGNPGAKYVRHRHNIGYMAIDRIATDHGFGTWKSRFQGRTSEGRLDSERILLLKPETFMNRSGQSVAAAARFFKLDPAQIIVFHDEIDLAPGKCRYKEGGGHAGHNGLRSLHSHIGGEYRRVRLGVGHPGHKDRVAAYVLHDFAKADADWLDSILKGISDGASNLAAGQSGKFMNAVALRTSAPNPSRPPTPRGKAGPTAAVASDTPTPDKRNPIRKLLEKFR